MDLPITLNVSPPQPFIPRVSSLFKMNIDLPNKPRPAVIRHKIASQLRVGNRVKEIGFIRKITKNPVEKMLHIEFYPKVNGDTIDVWTPEPLHVGYRKKITTVEYL